MHIRTLYFSQKTITIVWDAWAKSQSPIGYRLFEAQNIKRTRQSTVSTSLAVDSVKLDNFPRAQYLGEI